MDWSELAALRVVDSHVHFPYPALAGDLLQVMERACVAAVGLVSIQDARLISHNAAVLDCKARYPATTYILGALDHSAIQAEAAQGPRQAAREIGEQVRRLRAIGFDGLKLLESKPTARRAFDYPLDGPLYAEMWGELEESGFPVLWHVADPEEFWDAARCPDWAREHGWGYDGSFAAKEALYAEVERVLDRHPGLRVTLAHFYFLSADLPRAATFLDAHPGARFDLAPGIETYVNLTGRLEAAREFFLAYADRIVYGTDIGATSIGRGPEQGLDLADAFWRTGLIRQFLECDGLFGAPAEIRHGLGMDVQGLRGMALPAEALARIYAGNFEALCGQEPARLDLGAAVEELERQAAATDALAGVRVESPARVVARRLRG